MKNMPKRFKHRKVQKGTIRGNATRGHTVEFGEWGLQSLQAGYLTSRVLEAGRVAANRAAPGSRITIRVFPHKPVTSIPAETRMGKGKGEPEYWVASIKPGTVIFEIGGADESHAKLAMNRVAHKLPVKCRLVQRRVR
ncbi:MAG: 50S ribosomal protein L16 [Planctomycetota bacterium]|jgi:large subunit ribosomal protein L16|nr:50S ribosomal protein L16 [Planctomycetota bacterium]